MKKMIVFLVVIGFTALASLAFAAESVSVVSYGQTNQGKMFILKMTAQSGTTGLYTANRVITAAEAGFDYHKAGYFLAHCYAVNHASTYPDTAGTVTVADANGQQIVGSTVGDTLTLSTSASGVGYMSESRSLTQRPVYDLLNVTIADTQSGTATSVVYIYFVFVK